STSGYAWFAISDGTSSLRAPLQHRIALLHNTSLRALRVLLYAPYKPAIWASLGIYHIAHNRASGCNINNPLLTASAAKSATWGKPRNLKTTTVERLQIQQ
ncbi:MAG: hypothetical protein ACI30V_02060, partial [Muribaculaceae bacterium]